MNDRKGRDRGTHAIKHADLMVFQYFVSMNRVSTFVGREWGARLCDHRAQDFPGYAYYFIDGHFRALEDSGCSWIYEGSYMSSRC